MSTSSRPLVSPSVVSMQYYSKEAKHIVYLTFQVGGNGGGDCLTSLRITREPSSSSSGSSTWSGWMRTAWKYGSTSSDTECTTSPSSVYWAWAVHWRGEPCTPKVKKLILTGCDHGYILDGGADVFVRISMATYIFTDRMILNVDGPVAGRTHNPSRPLVSPSVVSMQYYSKGALHIVYLGFQVGGDRGGDFLTSLHITRESSSSSSGSSSWSGWMRTAWEYGSTSSGIGCTTSSPSTYWVWAVNWRGESHEPRVKKLIVTGCNYGYIWDRGAHVFVTISMATHIFADRMILNTDGPLVCPRHNSDSNPWGWVVIP